MNQSDNLQAIAALQRQLMELGQGEPIGTVEELATMLVNAAPGPALYYSDRCRQIAKDFPPESRTAYTIQADAILKAEAKMAAAAIRKSRAA